MAETVKTTTARAAPRRARKDPNEAPVFLQKTYQMIDTVCGIFCMLRALCDPPAVTALVASS